MTVSSIIANIYQKLVSSLPPLIDVTEQITTEDLLDENERSSLVESCASLITDYIEENPLIFAKPDYSATIRASVIELLQETLMPCFGVIDEEELQIIYQLASFIVFTTIVPRRSYKKSFVRKHKTSNDVIKRKLQDIRERPQSEQCTPQWYIDRWNRLSGSNAWKAFGTKSQQNSLIFEKCKPIEVEKYQNVNIESSLHHGKRFEPVSTQYYEYVYGAKVEEFGCVPHKEYDFIGASPDGIVVNEECSRFGRMLEIKNVTTRRINGIPKEEYWIQMQLQMEVCDLNECDFLETEIYTYPSLADFEADGTFQKSVDGKYKGVIAHYQVDGKPFYEYAPFQCSQEDFDKWEEEICEKHSNHTWITNLYYRIDTISCVLVLRNKKWMKSAINTLGDIWKQILYDRENGYEHRQPKSRSSFAYANNNKMNQGKTNCVINLVKLKGFCDDNNISTTDDKTITSGITNDMVTLETTIPKKRKTNNKDKQPALFVDIGSDDI